MTVLEANPRRYEEGITPYVEQCLEYRDLMVDIVRAQGRGIRRARYGERAHTRPGTEYMLPGAATEWSVPDRRLRTHIERERRYSASFRPIGAHAGRLLVLESDSVRDGLSYDTKRNIYRFGWDETKTIHEAEVLPISIVSGVQTDLEVLSNPFGGKGLIVADHERTMEQAADDGPGYFRYVNPWRESEYPWRCVDAADFDGLLARTDEFGRDLLAELERDVA